MRTSKKLLIALCAIFAGCSVTVPVAGRFSQSQDDFVGAASAAVFGTGTLNVQSRSGVSCTGTLERPDSLLHGSGELRCSDGRKGSFVFTKTNEMGGTGTGTLSDGEQFRFDFGNDARRAAAEPQTRDASQLVAACARQYVGGIDDGISDAQSVALALSLRCLREYQQLTEVFVSTLDNNEQRRMFRDRRSRAQEKIETFLPAVMDYRVALKKK